MVLERIAEFLGKLLQRHDRSDERQNHMSADLKTIIAKLNDQGATIASQGKQIDKLIADRDAKEQADLDQIDMLIDANASASNANASKMAAALAPAQSDESDDKPATPVVTSVAAATTAPTSSIVVTGDNAVPVDATIAGPGIVPGTTATDVATSTAADGSIVSTISLSVPTSADHVGDQSEQIVATPAAP